jgi:hypothetical protein
MQECPSNCLTAWKVFLELHNARGMGGFGYNPITFTEIASYCHLFEFKLNTWEIVLIRKFDSVVMELFAKRQESDNQKQEAKMKKKR